MSTGIGQVVELILGDGCLYLRVACPSNLIPSPGQYLLASNGSNASLPVPLFHTDSTPDGLAVAPSQHFIAVAPILDSWTPGRRLHLRGPLGRGFTLPVSARKVGLVAFDDQPARLRGLIRPALIQGAAVVMLCDCSPRSAAEWDSSPGNLPDEVEVQPLSMADEILEWADYLALDVAREHLPLLRERLFNGEQRKVSSGAQILIHTPIPCGGIAECGVCAVTLKSGWKLACKDGPVFDWKDIRG